MPRIVASILLIIVLIVAAMGTFGLMSRNKPQVQATEIEAVAYNVDVFEVSPVSFTELLTGFGTASAEREVVIAAQVNGEVTELHPALKVGHRVSSGRIVSDGNSPSEEINADILLKIDSRDYQQRVEQTESAIANIRTEILQLNQQEQNSRRQLRLANEDLQSLQEEFDRIKTLREKGAGSASDLTRSLLELRRYQDTIVQLENQIALYPHQIDAAKQRLNGSQSDLERAKYDLERTVVTPPFSGILAEVMVEQGQYVRSGEALVRLVDPDRIEIPVSIGFEDYMLIQDSIQAGNFPIAFLAENETAAHRWTGNVVRVAPTADSSSRTIEVFIEVINSEQSVSLLPGTFVFARIEGPALVDAILVPRETIVDGIAYVVDQNNLARPRKVTTGRHLQSMVVVSDGVVASDRIVMTNLDVINDGTKVLPQRSTNSAEEIARLRVPTIDIQSN